MPGRRQARRTWLLGAATAVTSGGSAAGTSAASTRRDRPQSGRPCAFRERKPAHLRLKWASNPFGRRRFASCECCNLSEVRLGEGQLVAALPVDRSGSDHKKARGKWMLRWQRRGLWRAQPSRTPSQRLGARRERATERDREDGAEQSRRSYSLVSAGEIEAIAWRRLQSKVGGIRRIGH